MIKNLFDFEIEPETPEQSAGPDQSRPDEAVAADTVSAFEVPVESRFFRDREPQATVITRDFDDEPTSELLGETSPIEMYEPVRIDDSHFSDDEPPVELADNVIGAATVQSAGSEEASETALVLSSSPSATIDDSEIIFSHAAPKSAEPFDAARARGLAFSAGIAVVGSVTFLMLLGWFADLLMGTKPWGVVGGIIIGGILGFVQLFRIAAQIFRK